jgi:hypothetical protein
MTSSVPKRVAESPVPDEPTEKKSRRGQRISQGPSTPLKKEKSISKSATTSPARTRHDSFSSINPDFGSEETVLCHPNAMKLFGEVTVALKPRFSLANQEDATDFRVASRIFWCALFAIQRGIPSAAVKNSVWTTIWNTKLSRTYKSTIAQDAARKSWEFEERHLLTEFERKFTGWKDAWMDSEAGQDFQKAVKTCRYAMSSVQV